MTDVYGRFPDTRTPTDDKDHVFARFKTDKAASANRRETVTVARRGGAPGSRVVEVVHVRSGPVLKDRPQRSNTHVRAASWDDVFTARQADPVVGAGEVASKPPVK